MRSLITRPVRIVELYIIGLVGLQHFERAYLMFIDLCVSLG